MAEICRELDIKKRNEMEEKVINSFDLVMDGVNYLIQRYDSFNDVTIKRVSEKDIEISSGKTLFHCDDISRVLNSVPGIQWFVTVIDFKPTIKVF